MRAGLAELAERTKADELIIATLTHSPAARLASYRRRRARLRGPEPGGAVTDPVDLAV